MLDCRGGVAGGADIDRLRSLASAESQNYILLDRNCAALVLLLADEKMDFAKRESLFQIKPEINQRGCACYG